MSYATLDDIGAVNGKRVLVRVDFNVPVEGGKVTDDTRIRASAATIEELAGKGAKVILLAHFGRPKGKRVASESLEPVVPAVAAVLGKPVAFADDCVGETATAAIGNMTPGEVLLLENTRFHAGEENNDPAFAADLARLGDLYVDDAFSAAHRAHASTEGVAHKLPAFAGRSMEAELSALGRALGRPERPLVAIVGGAKVSTKIDLLRSMLKKTDALVIGGAMANTFLAAGGVPMGKSLVERDAIAVARTIAGEAEAAGCALVLPKDAVVASAIEANAPHQTMGLDEGVPTDGMVLDVGPQSLDVIKAEIDQARTLVWNGPLGAFELAPFDRGTVEIANYVAERCAARKLMAVAGGGDTAAALNRAGVAERLTFVSTAGGAFLEWMEGKTLPGVEALRRDGTDRK